MADLQNRKWIVAKGLMFLGIGLLAGLYIVLLTRSALVALLLGLCIWSFCRFYYFLFYVLEKYVGVAGRYAGLWDLLRRLRRGR
jgi:hypothetical protein